MTSAQAARTAGLALLLFACSSSDEAETAQPAATAAQGGASAGAGAPAAGQAGKAQAGAAGAAQGSAGKPASAGSGGSAGQGNAGSDAGGAGGAMAGSPASGGAGGQAAGGEAASGQAGAGGEQAGGAAGESGAGGEAGSAGASPTGGAGGASGAGGSPAECTEGQHQGCECPIAGEVGLQACQADGSWGPCEGCPDYPVPVEGVDYNLCEDSGNPVGQCAGVPGYYGCITDFDDSFFEVWVTKHCKQQGAPFLCCDVPSACDRVAVNMVEPGVVLTCDEYEAETGVKVTNSSCKNSSKPCSVVRPALSSCWAMCTSTEANGKCPSEGNSECESTWAYEQAGPGAFIGCCFDL